jgi:hypothetical protein
MITHRQCAELCQMRPSNATARARSSNRPNSPIFGAIAGKSARNELRTIAKLVCRGFREPRGQVHRAARRFDGRRRHRSSRCRMRLSWRRRPRPDSAEIANDFPDPRGRLFEHGAVICLKYVCLGGFPIPALELIVTRPWAVEHGPAKRFRDALWNRLNFPGKPPLR